jgi:hypothetical protein
MIEPALVAPLHGLTGLRCRTMTALVGSFDLH